MKYFFAVILSLFCLPSFSQIELGPRISIGTVFADIDSTSDNIESGNADYGFGIGAYARFGTSNFKIMPELLYTSTAANINFKDGNNIDQVSKTELDKIDVPITIQVKTGRLLTLQGGVVGSNIINAEDSYKDSFDQAINNYKDFTFGYQAGIGVELGNAIIDIRYEGPLSEVSSSSESSPIQFDQRQQMLKASVGFNIF